MPAPALRVEVLAVVGERLARVVGRQPEQLAERALERRPNARLERLCVGYREPAPAQRLLDSARDARLRVGERAVEVEQQRAH